MALFKILKLTVKSEKTDFRVNIDGDGLFWCEPSLLMRDTLGIGKIIGHSYNEVQGLIYDAVSAYNEAQTKHTYTIKYKFHLSQRIKKQMPDELMTDEMWEKTKNYGGSNQFYKEEISEISKLI